MDAGAAICKGGWQEPLRDEARSGAADNDGKMFRPYRLAEPTKWPDFQGYRFGVFRGARLERSGYRYHGPGLVWVSLAERGPGGPTLQDLVPG